MTRMFVARWTTSMAGGLLFVFNSLTAYLATSTADFMNAFLMRVPEW